MSDSRLQSIFAEALDLPTAADRVRFLDDACGADSALRQQVETLLQAHEGAGSFFANPSKKASATPEDTQVVFLEKPGDRIGRYKLLDQLGEGGCGVVYLAEQEEPVRRQVALKVIKLGMDTRQVIARFEAERQALALMDHPHIARVLDAGSTEAGRPYFVMERVRGMKITEFCDQHKLTIEKRIRLFIQVCQAIQHAHQKGVIHRDIKPSNILVTDHDGEPVPKVIDFGIAKATQGRLTNHTLFTAFEQFIGTPAYMSPEQAVLTSQDVDTRSDIYSLGVLLYELLTGQTPFDSVELLAVGFDEMRRIIQEKEPVKPSIRLTRELSTTQGRKREREERRDGVVIEPNSPVLLLPSAPFRQPSHQKVQERKKQIELLRGDLDWIVMKCLEKARSRRYEAATALAADLGRYLQCEPITARPPSRWYALQKLAHRHRAALIGASTGVLALLLAVVVLTISNARIREEQSQKEAALALAQTNEQEAKAQLFTSLKSQAEARRGSRRIGQRVESLTALGQAAAIKRDADLRDAVTAALAVPDLRPDPTWQAYGTNDAAIAFDHDYARYAVIDEQSNVRICTVADHQEILRFPSGPPLQRRDHDRGFFFSPDGRWLAKFEKDNHWSFWEAGTGRLGFRSPPATGSALAFTRDSKQIAIPIGNAIILLDLQTAQEKKRWTFSVKPRALEFSPDQRFLAVGTLETPSVSIFNVEMGQLLSELPLDASSTDRALTWHPSGNYLAVSHKKYIQIWDVAAEALVSTHSHAQGHVQEVTTLSFDPAGTFLISDGWDGTPRLWHASPLREWIRFYSGQNTLRFSRDGRWAGAVYLGGGQAQLLELVPSQVYETFVGTLLDDQFSFHHADISPDGRLLALATRGVSIRELPGGRELAVLPVDYARFVKFHPNGRELLVSRPRDIESWPLHWKDSSDLRLGPRRPLRLAFDPGEFALADDGRTMAVADFAGRARMVDLETGAVHERTFSHQGIDSVALSPDGQWLAAAGWHSTQVQLWNVQTGERVLDLKGERGRVAFTADGQSLVVSRSQAFYFFDVNTRQLTRQIERKGSMHFGWVAFSHDKKMMAAEVAPGLIRLAEVATGRTLAHLQNPDGEISGWRGFTPDGTQLIEMAGYERALHRWDLRALRRELKPMGLDWEWPEFQPGPDAKQLPALKVEVVESARP